MLWSDLTLGTVNLRCIDFLLLNGDLQPIVLDNLAISDLASNINCLYSNFSVHAEVDISTGTVVSCDAGHQPRPDKRWPRPSPPWSPGRVF